MSTVGTWDIAGITRPKPTDPAVTILGANNEPMAVIRYNGTVELHPDVDVDEAAQRFWDAISRHIPAMWDSP